MHEDEVLSNEEMAEAALQKQQDAAVVALNEHDGEANPEDPAKNPATETGRFSGDGETKGIDAGPKLDDNGNPINQRGPVETEDPSEDGQPSVDFNEDGTPAGTPTSARLPEELFAWFKKLEANRQAIHSVVATAMKTGREQEAELYQESTEFWREVAALLGIQHGEVQRGEVPLKLQLDDDGNGAAVIRPDRHE